MNDCKKIINYLLPSEKLNFDVKNNSEIILHNQSSEKETEVCRNFKSTLGQIDSGELKTYLKVIETGENRKEYKFNSVFLRKIAAISIIIIFVLIAKNQLSNTPDYSKIYEDYFELYPNIVDPVTKGNNDVNIYKQYELEHYGLVIEKIKSINNLKPEESFYLASSYLAISDFVKAEEQFKKTINDSKYGQASEWYLALISLKTQKKKSKKLFEQIASKENHRYKQKAKELLKLIK